MYALIGVNVVIRAAQVFLKEIPLGNGVYNPNLEGDVSDQLATDTRTVDGNNAVKQACF